MIPVPQFGLGVAVWVGGIPGKQICYAARLITQMGPRRWIENASPFLNFRVGTLCSWDDGIFLVARVHENLDKLAHIDYLSVDPRGIRSS